MKQQNSNYILKVALVDELSYFLVTNVLFWQVLLGSEKLLLHKMSLHVLKEKNKCLLRPSTEV